MGGGGRARPARSLYLAGKLARARPRSGPEFALIRRWAPAGAAASRPTGAGGRPLDLSTTADGGGWRVGVRPGTDLVAEGATTSGRLRA